MRREEAVALERRLRRQQLPAAPDGLASRILAAARALPEPATISWSDRLWFSRAARLGWAAALLLLLAAEIVLAPRSAARPRTEPAEVAYVAGLAAELNLDPSWGARLAVADAERGPGLAEICDAVDAL